MVDNGREFLTYDVGGLGHRKKKPKDGQERFEPPRYSSGWAFT